MRNGDRLPTTQNERLAVVETQVTELRKAFEEHKDHTNEEFDNVNKKLDDLLALRNKGAGVFWLVSGLLGTGIVGMVFQLISWFRGN
jgi:hypothetical protein